MGGTSESVPAAGPRPSAAEATARRDHRQIRLGLLVLQSGPLLILLVIAAAVGLLTERFYSWQNLGNVLDASSTIGVLAIGQLLVIVSRGIDLSVGSIVALSAVVGVKVFTRTGSTALTIVTIVGVGALVGVVNGIIFVKGRLPHPFIATLAMLTAANGLALALANGHATIGMPHLVTAMGGTSIGSGPFWWLPYSAFVLAGVALAAFVLTRRMLWGRWLYAYGGSPEAASRTGMPVDGLLISVYALSGFAAGIAGLIVAGRTNAADPLAGTGFELQAIAAVIIGGASFMGGRGRVGDALVGALIIGVIQNGLNLAGVEPYYQPIVIGVAIVVAVEFDVLRRGLESRLKVRQALGGA